MKERKIKFVANGFKWFDKVNGNTYHSVRIVRCRDGATVTVPFTYGYGDHYKETALLAMGVAGWLPKKYNPKPGFNNSYYLYERDNNYPIMWTIKDGLKRDCVANGVL